MSDNYGSILYSGWSELFDPEGWYNMSDVYSPHDLYYLGLEEKVALYDPKNVLKLKMVPPPPPDLPEKRVYVLWLVITMDEDEEGAYWDYEVQKSVMDIIGGVFTSEDRAQFAADQYQRRKGLVSSRIQLVKLNELLWEWEAHEL